MNERHERESIVGPILLIGLGVIFLLNNLGLLAWHSWGTLLRLWPVLLIAWGIELIFGDDSIWGQIIAAALIVAALAGAVWLTATPSRLGAEQTLEISHPLDDAARATIRLERGAGRIIVDALEDSTDLVEGVAYHLKGEKIREDYDKVGNEAIFTLTSQNLFAQFTPQSSASPAWELSLNPRPDLTLNADLGVGEFSFDLSDMNLDEVVIDFAVGSTTVTLPEAGDYTLDIDGAIGQIIIEVPRGTAVRIDPDTALVGRDFPASYREAGDAYVSPGYDEAESYAEVAVDLAIGSVDVRELGGD
ncbi:MAG: hypothetical protein GVY30_09320 [Chloroflexi bacterium]|jgi:hypothetical protein|nr:hypothetical protein [Chloroflexota bacterium]